MIFFLKIGPVFREMCVTEPVLSEDDDEKKIVVVYPTIKSRPSAATLFSVGIFHAPVFFAKNQP